MEAVSVVTDVPRGLADFSAGGRRRRLNTERGEPEIEKNCTNVLRWEVPTRGSTPCARATPSQLKYKTETDSCKAVASDDRTMAAVTT